MIVVSLAGAAAISGLLPNARSDGADSPGRNIAPAADKAIQVAPSHVKREAADPCSSCGTVQSIRSIERKGDATGLGAAAGGVTGAVIGSQIGRGHGNTAMTILGAAGGALAGNEIEKNVKKHYSYHVTMRMDDGTFRTVSQSTAPTVAVGSRVRIANGILVERS
ncbi:MAG: glycine zipper 2TM domain-containing protein [Proteobacteria bacterium]|nr:glycine zipper 2TM domain-containing protein [Pseudomonadota bacterium]